MEHRNDIIFTGESDESRIIYDYVPKKFPITMDKASNDFVSKQSVGKSDFVLSDLIAEQTGIADRHKLVLEEKIEEEALAKLKEVQEKAYHEAYELGLIEGVEKGFQEKKEEIEERITKMDDLLGSFSSLTTDLVAEKENQILKLISKLANKIAMFEIKSRPEGVKDLIEKLFEEMQAEERVVLRVSPEDAIFIEGSREKLSAEYNITNIKLEPDDEIQSGGCIVESNYGMIDASIEQRVERAWMAIKNRLPRVNEDRIEVEDIKEEIQPTESDDTKSDDEGDS